MFFFYKFKFRNCAAEKVRLNKKIIKLNFKSLIFCNNYFNANYLYFIIFEFLVHRKSDKCFKYIRRNVAYEVSSWKTIDVARFFARNNIKNVEAEKSRFLRHLAEL